MEHIIMLSVIGIGLASCAHPAPREWWPSSHHKMMQECRMLCKNDVDFYESETAKCACKKGGVR